jgi:hypothetical protein
MSTSTINVQMFLDVADEIEAHADRFDLTSWIAKFNTAENANPHDDFDNWDPRKTIEGVCNSVLCVGGWMNLLIWETTGEKVHPGNAIRAAEALGITHGYEDHPNIEHLRRGSAETTIKEGTQAHSLFIPSWRSVWCEQADHYGWDFTTDPWGDIQDDNVAQITGHQAADLLRRIARGEVTL